MTSRTNTELFQIMKIRQILSALNCDPPDITIAYRNASKKQCNVTIWINNLFNLIELAITDNSEHYRFSNSFELFGNCLSYFFGKHPYACQLKES